MSLPSYTCGPQNKPLLPMTIGAAFDRTVERFPRREALVVRHQNLRYTWAELAQAVDRCARGLLALGLQPGERLGIWSPNNAQWCITQFATAKIGVVLVNINPAYRLSELEYALKQSGCRWLICADAFKTSDYHAMLHELLPELENAALGALQSHMLPELRGVISLCDKPLDGMLPWPALMEMAEQVGPEQLRQCSEHLQFDDPINISTPPAPPASPRAPPSVTTTSSTTATWSARASA